MSFWWNTVALPIIGFMRYAKYPEDAVQRYILFLRDEILPLLGPCKSPPYPSWMTDDHTPVEFGLVLKENDKSSVRFAIEPSVLPLAGDRSVRTLRHVLERLSMSLAGDTQFDLEWFNICAEELLLDEKQEPLKHTGHAVSEIFIGITTSAIIVLFLIF